MSYRQPRPLRYRGRLNRRGRKPARINELRAKLDAANALLGQWVAGRVCAYDNWPADLKPKTCACSWCLTRAFLGPTSTTGAPAPTPPEICTHPAIDLDGLCKACLDKVALAFPVEFAKRMAAIDRGLWPPAPTGEACAPGDGGASWFCGDCGRATTGDTCFKCGAPRVRAPASPPTAPPLASAFAGAVAVAAARAAAPVGDVPGYPGVPNLHLGPPPAAPVTPPTCGTCGGAKRLPILGFDSAGYPHAEGYGDCPSCGTGTTREGR